MIRTVGAMTSAILCAAVSTLFVFATVNAKSPEPSRWSIAAGATYSPIEYGDRENQGGGWCSVRYSISRRMQVMGETGFTRYGEPDTWFQFADSGPLDIIPVSVGLGVNFPFAPEYAQPFIRVLPTMFHSRGDVTAGFPTEGLRTYTYSEWTFGVQASAGFAAAITNGIGIEVSIRMALTPTAEGNLEDFHQTFGLAGLNVQL